MKVSIKRNAAHTRERRARDGPYPCEIVQVPCERGSLLGLWAVLYITDLLSKEVSV